ncbi:C-type lectin domain family 4 member M-like [Scomber scombrus]|uniref:C-type lectin domain family 4 member M-like n=1 Tax=Scomber scombrus TaxID=13677 RepID=UPI002DDBFE02|nr:C-type lectin domain family 4 member M-like [Scomber scombrus]
MENSQPQTEPEEEMSFEQKISEDFNNAGHLHSHRQRFGQGCFTEGGGSAFPRDRLVILSLSLLNAVLLIAAVVVGIYCAKANDNYLQIPHSTATDLTIELSYLRNHSAIIKAKLEAEATLSRERASHMELKLQVKHQNTLTDDLQSQIETLLTEKTSLQSNKSALDESCGRCLPGWNLLKSRCYYFSNPMSSSKKNWPDSRADCISRGGDMIVINNLQEQQLISNNYPKVSSSNSWWQNGFWIGLTDVVLKGTWVWINNLTEAETMYWKSGQPREDGLQSGNCAAFSYYDDAMRTWYNGNCNDHLLNWICEMDQT